MKKFSTVKEWTIKAVGDIDDLEIVIREGSESVRYDISMEEAIISMAALKKDIRNNPNCDYFEIHFGGMRHGFSRSNIVKFCQDLKEGINRCLSFRVSCPQKLTTAESLRKEPVVEGTGRKCVQMGLEELIQNKNTEDKAGSSTIVSPLAAAPDFNFIREVKTGQGEVLVEDTADTNFLKMPESVSTTPDPVPSAGLLSEKEIVDIVSGANEVAKGRGRKKK